MQCLAPKWVPEGFICFLGEVTISERRRSRDRGTRYVKTKKSLSPRVVSGLPLRTQSSAKTIDCKDDTTLKTFRDTNMTRTDKAGLQQWTAVDPTLAALIVLRSLAVSHSQSSVTLATRLLELWMS